MSGYSSVISSYLGPLVSSQTFFQALSPHKRRRHESIALGFPSQTCFITGKASLLIFTNYEVYLHFRWQHTWHGILHIRSSTNTSCCKFSALFQVLFNNSEERVVIPDLSGEIDRLFSLLSPLDADAVSASNVHCMLHNLRCNWRWSHEPFATLHFKGFICRFKSILPHTEHRFLNFFRLRVDQIKHVDC